MFKKIILSLFAFYIIIGFFVVPFVLKPQIIDIVTKQTNAKITIDSVSFNPLICKLGIEGLRLSSLDDKELLYLKAVSLNVELYSLLNSAIHISDFEVYEPKISLVLDKNKQINFMSILKPSKEVVEVQTSETTEIPRIILDRIAVVNGSINYEDYTQKSKFEFAVDSLGFVLKNIDTKEMQKNDAHLRFYTKLEDGGFIDLKSEILGVEPLIVKGTLDYEASKLYTQWRYVKDSLNLEVADGKLSLNAEYYFNIDKLEETMLSNVNVHLDNLRIKPKGEAKDILTLKSLYLDNATVKPLAQDVLVEKVALHSLHIKAKRDTAGIIDWLEYIKINQEKQAEVKIEEVGQEDTKEEVKPWNVLVKKIALEKIKVDFKDSGIKPAVNTSLNDLNIYVQNLTLDGVKPLDYQMNLTLNEKFKCTSQGSVVHSVLDATSSIKCTDLDIEHFVPYIDDIAKGELKLYDVKLRSLVAGFDANITAKDINSSIVIDVNNANLSLDNFALNKKSVNKRLVTFSALDVRGITLNTASKEVKVKATTLQGLNLRTQRLKDGSLSLENLVVPRVKKASKKTKISKTSKKEKDYRVSLKHFVVKGARVSFVDKTLTPSLKAKIDRIYLSARNIDSKKYSWMNYYMSARINGSGKMKTSGAIRHTPLKQKGKFELNRISLKEITPYLKEHAYVSLEDGYLSLNAKTSYAVSKTKPDLSVNGSFKIEEFFVNDTRDNSSLVSFSKLDLKEFTLETAPKRLFINEVDINSFYVNAIIDANKTMNFAGLTKDSDTNATQDTNTTTAEDINTTKVDPFPVKIMKINVKDGSAFFSDNSLPIKFKTAMHDLNGEIYSVSTTANETSYIDIVGEIDEYGSTKLKGSINTSNPKAFTDLSFNFRNLDLSAMSGYSSTFAGYKIESGKLFLNLNYDIKDSQLLGENSIIIKKIKLGEEVDIEGGSLPLGFVIGLLEDSDGIIDIDMPIRGNLDEPDFKYGALVWKTFGNLILSAVTSPFRFLGSMLGIGGDELEYAEFEGGSSALLPSEREKLDNVAKLMIKRPKLVLSIAGGYNVEVDKEAMQKEKLINLVVKLSGAKNEEEKVNAMTIDLLEDIYEDARDDDRLDKIEDELEKKYEDEAFDRAYLLALVKECSDIQVVTFDEIYALASKRTLAIKSYLIDMKGVEPSRVNELEIVESEIDDKRLVKSKLEVIVK